MRRWSLLVLALSACNGRIGAPYGQALPGRDDVSVTEYRAHVASGLSDPVSIDLPAGTGSALIELEGSRGQYRLAQLVTPGGNDLVESGGFVTRDAREVNGLVDWLYPNTPSLTLTPGGHRLRFTALDGAAPVDDDVTVRVYQHSRASDGASIKVDLLVADGAFATQDLDGVASRVMGSVARLYAQIGMRIGDYTVRRVQLGTAELSLDGKQGDAVNLAVAAARAGAVHVLIAASIEDHGGVVAGYSLGLPGPVEGDRPNAAVLVSAGPFASPSDGSLDEQGLAVTCAHEIGHYLGLYHTSERDGRQHDPIADTAECTGTSACDGASNVMFWTGGATRYRFSPGQGQVVRSHPLAAPDASVAPAPQMCELACDPPRTCAILAGESRCLVACDPADALPCSDGSDCRASDDGTYVCR
jgi:hypothetical protein